MIQHPNIRFDLVWKLLNAAPHYAQHEVIDVAKGKYELATDKKSAVKKFKRSFKTLTTSLWPKKYK
jgi:hypothetical protein